MYEKKSLFCIRNLIKKSKLNLKDSWIIMSHLLKENMGWSNSALITKDLEPLSNSFVAQWTYFSQCRLNGQPIAYILGYKYFYNLQLTVNPMVLIPRQETELLVEVCIDFLNTDFKNKKESNSIQILDLGTGSGAIGLSIAHNIKDVFVHATDISQSALQVAKKNADKLNIKNIKFIESDWFENIENQYFEIIVSNPPYIHIDDLHLSSSNLYFEPQHALTDYTKNFEAYYTIISNACKYLSNKGILILEHGYDQSSFVLELLKQYNYKDIQIYPDLSGINRAISARFN